MGLERGWREREAPDRSRTAGIRTYGLSGLLGGVFALLASSLGSSAVLVSGLVVFAAVLGLYKLREAIADDDFSATGLVAALGVFALGALAVAGDYRLAAGGGAALAAILASREVLHGLLQRMTWVELRAALILAVMTAIIMPLLPDRTVDPWGGVNPRQIWLFTILVATISYGGYVAIRLLGPGRGLLASSLLGAIVSSTAVTLVLARRAQEAPVRLAGAASFAAAVSTLRVLAVAVIAAPAMLVLVGPPAIAAAAVFAAAGGALMFGRPTDAAGGIELKNPFEVGPLLAFAALFTVISAASAYLTTLVGDRGMVAASAISGLFDVDVAVLSAARQISGEAGVGATNLSAVAEAILLALLANAVGRASLAALAAPWRFTAAFLAVTGSAALAGAAIHFL